jgi:hypothetical protein
LSFDLDDKDIEDLLFFLKSKLSNDIKKSLKTMYTILDEKYEDSVDSRDWTDCEFICNEKDLLKKLI